MSCTLPRPVTADNRKLHAVQGSAGAVHDTISVPQSMRLVGAQESAGKIILLAYGSEPIRRVLAAMMIRQGFSVTCCGDGDAALRYLRSGEAELVVTGMVMPNMDGLELIRHLQSQHTHLPIVALAEEADQMSRIYLRFAGLAGAARTCTVPVGRESLLGAIDDILGGGTHAIRTAV